jgi:glycyl-tRNA synthetase beta chain
MASDFLLEIGTEEIPASYIQPALDAMATMIGKFLSERRVDHGAVRTMATPRRLVWMIKDVTEEQKAQTVEITGPPKEVAFDEAGNPTQAALGFAKSQGVSPEELQVKETGKGEYVVVSRQESGVSTVELLAGVFPDLIGDIPFPKSMRWGDLKVTFARPIHWIVALLGKEVIPFTYGNVTSGNTSYGHRFMSPGPFEVSDINGYVEALRERFVIVDIEERRERIREIVAVCAKEKKGNIREDEDLLDEVVQLAEYPTAVCGSFDQHYLELPPEVLITAMRFHQRYFAVLDDAGKMMPYFVTVNNTLTRDPQVVAEGNEYVLRARLEDARFYYVEDQKVSLDDRVEELKEVVFHSKLGTSYEKLERFKALAEYMADQIAPDDKTTVSRAAFLCKADLVTGTVGEFPELQGIMGRGDKLDTVVGCFGVGQIPTGTADPFALRRQALGIIRIILEKDLSLSLSELIKKALSGLDGKLTEPDEQTYQGVLDFFRVRLQHFLIGQGQPQDVVEAVLAYHLDPLVETAAKISTLKAFKENETFEPLVGTVKRVVNILKEPVDGEVDPDLFVNQAEKDLYQEVVTCEQELEKVLAERDYGGVLERLSELKGPIDHFFDDVMVLDKDVSLRQNRLALLTRIANLFRQLADFSRLVL